MCFIHAERSRYRARARLCRYQQGTKKHDGIGCIVTIPYIVGRRNMNYTFTSILQSDNTTVKCVVDLLAPTFTLERMRKDFKKLGVKGQGHSEQKFETKFLFQEWITTVQNNTTPVRRVCVTLHIIWRTYTDTNILTWMQLCLSVVVMVTIILLM